MCSFMKVKESTEQTGGQEGMNVQTRTPEVEAENSRRRSERECENASERPGSGRDFGAKMSSPTETERCIESLIAVFQKYAGRDGNRNSLSKTEFLTFMNTELAAFTKNQKDPGVLDRMMKKLDTNRDGQLDFQEFLNLIGGLAVACHDSLNRSQK
ncbi:protein S100-A11 isoform X1 [Pteropus vampyrus]|uniref:Protein S100-A11 n=1 Tax=Pteropus vampyrus TaxID=132908 RepID=A0A6P6BR80_PTEVA|nr:protein S100-A11 isoform X1 [Pteropus vampyrus]